MAKHKYSIWITLKKVFIFLAEMLIAGLLVFITERPELIFLAPILEGIRNYIKNAVMK